MIDQLRPLCSSALALLAGAVIASPAGSQQPAAAAAQPSRGASFQEVVEVNIVNLTVRVSDREGSPVPGLGRDDFEILEDGQPVPIANFYEVAATTDYERVGRDRAARSRSGAPAAPAEETAAPDQRQEAAPVRHLAIFVDNANIHPRNRQLVFRGLRDFLHDRTGPQDRIMVVAFRNDYEVLQPFTDANADVVQAIDRLERSGSEGAQILSERRMVIRDLQSADLTPFRGQAAGNLPARMKVESESRVILQRIEQHARETRQRTLNTLGALRYLTGSMSGLPEPKAVLYLSDGLEMRPAESLFQAHWERFRQASETLEFDVQIDPPESLVQEYDLSREFTAFAADAQAAGVAFFAIDGSGQTATLGGSAEFSLRDAGSVALSNYAPVWSPQLETLQVDNRQSTLRLLAEETGGEVLLNTRNYDSFFDDLRRSLDSYYSLGFRAPHDRDGRRHRIEVRVKRPGLVTQYQRAYVDKPLATQLAEQTVSTLVLGAPIGDVAVTASAGKPVPQDGKLVLPVRILVPVEALGLFPEGADRVANLSLVIVTKDAKGNTRPAQAMELRLRLTPEQLATAANGEANIRLLIDPEPQQIGIGVRDLGTGRTATAVLAVDPKG